jgi:hypothetical protein
MLGRTGGKGLARGAEERARGRDLGLETQKVETRSTPTCRQTRDPHGWWTGILVAFGELAVSALVVVGGCTGCDRPAPPDVVCKLDDVAPILEDVVPIFDSGFSHADVLALSGRLAQASLGQWVWTDVHDAVISGRTSHGFAIGVRRSDAATAWIAVVSYERDVRLRVSAALQAAASRRKPQ